MGKDYLGADQRKTQVKEEGEEKEIKALDEGDIALLKSYGQGQYTKALAKDWHCSHFCCWQCGTGLTSRRYVLTGDQPCCIQCYENNSTHVCIRGPRRRMRLF